MSCEHCDELELELAALRMERDQLLTQKQATREWLGELLYPSPIGDDRSSVAQAHYQQLAREFVRRFPHKKIEAIKGIRQASQVTMPNGETVTKLGLLDAKNYVEAAYAERDRGRPDLSSSTSAF